MSEVLVPSGTRILSRIIKHRMRPVPVDEEGRRGQPGTVYVLVDVNECRGGICRPVFVCSGRCPRTFPAILYRLLGFYLHPWLSWSLKYEASLLFRFAY